jgi:hypothetical protein
MSEYLFVQSPAQEQISGEIMPFNYDSRNSFFAQYLPEENPQFDL